MSKRTLLAMPKRLEMLPEQSQSVTCIDSRGSPVLGTYDLDTIPINKMPLARHTIQMHLVLVLAPCPIADKCRRVGAAGALVGVVDGIVAVKMALGLHMLLDCPVGAELGTAGFALKVGGFVTGGIAVLVAGSFAGWEDFVAGPAFEHDIDWIDCGIGVGSEMKTGVNLCE